ncbi:MAG: threonine synthase [Pseudomonadota bacterium]
MKYVSTRGEAPELGFSDAILAGLARDGGLYLPQTWPRHSGSDIAQLANRPYAEVAYTLLRPFVGDDIPDARFRAIVNEAYATFRHPAVAPLVQTDAGHFLLELFHGPTLAFKDVAMQLLGRLMDHVLRERGRRATIVGATSGDTGGAAIDAFRSCDNIDIFILFPKGRVSPVQQRQMTTIDAPNVHALAIEGSFDDCQARVKDMFNHFAFRDRVSLSGVNSINWGRIMAQIVYYFTSAVALGSPHRPVSFTVPTGNFGDIFAGYAAKCMGLPVDKLVIATNVNDILDRALRTGRYEVTDVKPTTSPSMDIQVSSNFERLLFEAAGRDAGSVREQMAGLKQSGAFTIPRAALEVMRRDFLSSRASEEEVRSMIADTLARTGYLLDPHTAVGSIAAERARAGDTPMVTLVTAHASKFPDAVREASGVHPELPAWTGDLMQRAERMTELPNDLSAIETFIADRSRATTAEA